MSYIPVNPMADSSSKPEHILFITGRLAEKGLKRVLDDMQLDCAYTVHELGLSVAALMTTEMIKRRLKDTFGATRVILPGRFRGRLDELSEHFGIPFERGPEEFKDLPTLFGKQAPTYLLNEYEVNIFAEIVDAPNHSPEAILAMAERHRHNGADVVDLGFLPDTAFPHLQDAIVLLKENNFKVSVDTHDPEDLLTAARSGADYLLSLKRETLAIADQTDAVPIIIPDTPQQPETLYEAIETLLAKGRPFIADPILDPIHCGFTDSIVRYHALHQRYPQVEVMMGTGNLTELTHADSAGVTALLLGVISELGIKHLLTTEVSEHCRNVVRETDVARRVMLAARKENIPPTKISNELMMLHERKPHAFGEDEIKAFADEIKDRNFRVQVSEKGVHVYNRDLYKTVDDPFDVYKDLDVADDGGHAFYLGVELARAQIAFQLGKRYSQDEELDWGCAVEREREDLTQFKAAGATQEDRRAKRKNKK